MSKLLWIVGLGFLLTTLSGCSLSEPRTDLSGFGLTDETRTRMLNTSEATREHVPNITLPAKIAVIQVHENWLANIRTNPDGTTEEITPLYRIILDETFPTDQHLATLRAMPDVADAWSLDRRALGSDGVTADQVLLAARQQGATLLLVCGMSITTDEDDRLPPLSLLTIGLSPHITLEADATAQGLLLNVDDNDSIVAFAETEGEAGQIANIWSSPSAQSVVMRRASRRSLTKLINTLEPGWQQLVARDGMR